MESRIKLLREAAALLADRKDTRYSDAHNAIANHRHDVDVRCYYDGSVRISVLNRAGASVQETIGPSLDAGLNEALRAMSTQLEPHVAPDPVAQMRAKIADLICKR